MQVEHYDGVEELYVQKKIQICEVAVLCAQKQVQACEVAALCYLMKVFLVELRVSLALVVRRLRPLTRAQHSKVRVCVEVELVYDAVEKVLVLQEVHLHDVVAVLYVLVMMVYFLQNWKSSDDVVWVLQRTEVDCELQKYPSRFPSQVPSLYF